MTDEPLRRLIQAADGLPFILVGGHATVAWARYYALDPVATTDLDWQTSSLRELDLYAERAAVDEDQRQVNIHAAVMSVASDTGKPFIIDFLTTVHGVDARELQERAVTLRLYDVDIAVMHPVHLVISRIKNLALPTRSARVESDVGQARIAIRVCTQYLAQKAGCAQDRPARKRIKRLASELWTLAKSPEGKTARRVHGLNPFDAVTAWEGMDDDFRTRWYPKHLQKSQRDVTE